MTICSYVGCSNPLNEYETDTKKSMPYHLTRRFCSHGVPYCLLHRCHSQGCRTIRKDGKVYCKRHSCKYSQCMETSSISGFCMIHIKFKPTDKKIETLEISSTPVQEIQRSEIIVEQVWGDYC